MFVLSDPRLPVGDLSGDQATVMRVQSIRGLTARPAILAEVVNSGYKTALLTAGANQVCAATTAAMRNLLDAPTELAACCGFDLCHMYFVFAVHLYLYLRLT